MGASEGGREAAKRLTGGVCKLVLLAFYAVLERLGVAPCDLNLLLDGFGVHGEGRRAARQMRR